MFSVPKIPSSTTTIGYLRCFLDTLDVDAEVNCHDHLSQLSGKFKDETSLKQYCKRSDWDLNNPFLKKRFKFTTDGMSQDPSTGVKITCVGKAVNRIT